MDPIILPDSLVTQLRAYEARLRRMETLVAAACGLAGLLTTFVLLFVADRFVDTPRWARAILTFTGGALPAWFAHAWARHWLWNRRGPAQLAKLLQSHFRTLGDRLQGIIELTESPNLPPNISPALLRAAVRQVAEESSRFEFREAVAVRPARRWGLIATVLAALAAAPFVFVPRAATNTLARWMAPWSHIDRYTFASFEALPSEMIVPHGEPFEIHCGLKADSAWKPSTVTARLNRQEPQEARLEQGHAVFKIDGQTRDGLLALRMGDASRQITIRPLHRPEMRQLEARVHLPDYLGYPETTVPIQGSSVDFLEGSKVSFAGKTTRTLGQAAMQMGKAEPAAAVQGEGFVTPDKPVSELGKETVFHWTDTHGLTPTQPYTLHVGTTKDAEPRIDVQGLDPEMAILPDEVLKLNLTASDDYGLKDVWLAWNARTLGEKKEAIGKGEAVRIAGAHTKKEIVQAAQFSPAWEKIPEDSVVELTAYAADYMPDHKPAPSWKYTVYILSSAKHAERVRERMDQVLKELDERIRDEERQVDETKSIAQDPKQMASEKAAEDIKRIEAGEQTNETQLDKLTREMDEVLHDALRNKEIPESTVADWQQLTQTLEQQADPPMQGAVESLQNAGQQPNERQEQMAQAQKQQQSALDAMRKAAKKMSTANENLYARNFYNRLRAAASAEHQVSDGLKTLARVTAGLKPEEIAEENKKDFGLIAAKQDDATKDVDKIVNDMGDFVKRLPNEKYEAVEKEMQEKKVVSELTELAGFVRANLGLKSVRGAKTWGDQLDEWASMLQSESKKSQSGGDGEVDPDLMELMVAMVRAAQAQDNIRDETELLEGKKEADPTDHVSDSKKLAMQQDQLYWSVDELREKTKFKDAKPALQAAEDLMKEVAGDLRKPKTDAEVMGKQGTIIEILVPPDKKGGGQSNSKMQQMMRQMMAQATKARSGGGNNAKSSTNMAGQPGEGAGAGRSRATDRTVDKTGGAANSGDWPEEFRDQLQAYFQATEGEGKK